MGWKEGVGDVGQNFEVGNMVVWMAWVPKIYFKFVSFVPITTAKAYSSFHIWCFCLMKSVSSDFEKIGQVLFHQVNLMKKSQLKLNCARAKK